MPHAASHKPRTKRQHKSQKKSLKQRLFDNGLSVVTIAIFLLCWLGQAVSGNIVYNTDSVEHGQAPLSFVQYLGSAHFWEATTENWESEFLQMSAMVVLTIFLRQKGSPESKTGDDDEQRDRHVRGKHARYNPANFLYRNSLGLCLFMMFAVSFIGHAASSFYVVNSNRQAHHQHHLSFGAFVASPTLWFQSMQNWQSEFLAVGTLAILTIFFRQEGSPQSKRMDQSDDATGDSSA
jgi:hypothetical protein